MIGIIAGILTTISAMPQAIKTIRTRDVNGLSFLMYTTLVLGQVLWLLHGLKQQDIGLIFANIISLGINSIILYLIIRYRK